jgi:hypothetical protein
MQRPHRVHSSVDDSSLFDHLESTWVLRPGPQPGTTWLVFKVDFAFRSALYRHVADLFFDQVVRRMMGAFEGRCAQLYGPSTLATGGAGAGARRQPAGAGVGAGGDHLPHYQQRQHIQQQQQQQQQHHARSQILHQQPYAGDRLEPLGPRGGGGAPQARQQRPALQAPPNSGVEGP